MGTIQDSRRILIPTITIPDGRRILILFRCKILGPRNYLLSLLQLRRQTNKPQVTKTKIWHTWRPQLLIGHTNWIQASEHRTNTISQVQTLRIWTNLWKPNKTQTFNLLVSSYRLFLLFKPDNLHRTTQLQYLELKTHLSRQSLPHLQFNKDSQTQVSQTKLGNKDSINLETRHQTSHHPQLQVMELVKSQIILFRTNKTILFQIHHLVIHL